MTRIGLEEYQYLESLLAQESGLDLGKDKEYLLVSRLEPVIQRNKLTGFTELVSFLRAGRDPCLKTQVVHAMTTNESLFFRDIAPFDLLRQRMIPELLPSRMATRTLRIWSAACSTGQEPYSIAMTLLAMPELMGWNIEIVATDICSIVLERAREGIYSAFEVQRGLTPDLLARHFERTEQGWKIRDEIKRMVRFSELNLIRSFTEIGTFDLIFCRNVLIYFDPPTKGRVLDALALALRPDGFIILGGAEGASGLTDRIERVPWTESAVYRRSRRISGTEERA